jgi:MFS family permease
MTIDHSRKFRFGMGGGLLIITSIAFLRAPLLPDIGRDLGLSALGLGGLGSAFALGRLTADFPAGAFTDRSRPGAMMAIAAGIVAVGSLVFGLSPVAAIAFVAAFGLGVGSTWTLTGSMAFFARAPRVQRGASMAFFAGALLLGQAVGPFLGGILGALWDWRVAMIVGSVVAAALVPFFLRHPGVSPETTGTEDRGSDDDAIPRPVLSVLYLLPVVQFSIGAAIIQTLVPIVGDDELQLGAATVGIAIGLGGLARLIGAIVSGRLSDKIGRKWAMIPGLSLQTVGLALFAVVGGLVAWWLAILALTLGSVSVNVGSTMLADLTEGGGLGRQLGAFRFAGDLGLMVFPLLSGALYEVGGRMLGTLPLLVLTAAATIGAVIVLPETLQK